MALMIALVRGINVGGKNRLPMATLRSVATDAGFDDVATYVQSGNVVFRAPKGAAAAGGTLRKAIRAEAGLDVAVITRTAREWSSVIRANPFPDAVADGTKLHVMFFDDRVGDRLAGVDPDRFAPESFAVRRREVYMSLPDGLGRSRLAIAIDRELAKAGLAGTTRNWRTILKLAELAGG